MRYFKGFLVNDLHAYEDISVELFAEKEFLDIERFKEFLGLFGDMQCPIGVLFGVPVDDTSFGNLVKLNPIGAAMVLDDPAKIYNETGACLGHSELHIKLMGCILKMALFYAREKLRPPKIPKALCGPIPLPDKTDQAG